MREKLKDVGGRQRSKRGHRKAWLSAALALVLGVALVASLLHIASLWIIPAPIIRKPTVPPIRKALTQEALKRAELDRALNEFDQRDIARDLKVQNARSRLASISHSASGSLARESDVAAQRLTKLKFGGSLTWAEFRSVWPKRLGGDPRAVEVLVKEAIGPGSSAIHRKAGGALIGTVAALGADAEPAAARIAIEKMPIHQLNLGRSVMVRAPAELRKMAARYGANVAERSIVRAPGTVLDGPLPFADVGLFAWALSDIYRLGANARMELRTSLATTIREENLVRLQSGVEAVDRSVTAFSWRQKYAACMTLRLAFENHRLEDFRGQMLKRCPA